MRLGYGSFNQLYLNVNGQKFEFCPNIMVEPAVKTIMEECFSEDYVSIAEFVENYANTMILEEQFNELLSCIEQVRIPDEYSDEYVPRNEIQSYSIFFVPCSSRFGSRRGPD